MDVCDAQEAMSHRLTGGALLVLTGAGLSAASGIPTFRGPEGYWTEGSRHYQPQELATQQAFAQQPATVWRWYLHRHRICRAAEPNQGHQAIAAMEDALGDRLTLVTQNVDNLHLRAGTTPQRCLEIHGNIGFARCANRCHDTRRPLPQTLPQSVDPLPEETLREHLSCPDCGGWLRPHVLWFDEYYEEELFRADTAVQRATRADVLLIVGTAGATTLPHRIVELAAAAGACIIEINPERTVFSSSAEHSPGGGLLLLPSEDALPPLANCLHTKESNSHG